MLTKNLSAYIDELSSNSPTPGGGNVSALCGVLSASLGVMVCNLTIGKKKYAEVEEEMKAIKDKLEGYKTLFINFADKDNEAFDKVMEAFKLPKETDEQKSLRENKIDEATFEAASVPADVIRLCSEVIPLIETVSRKGNKNSASDAGVAALLISTAAQGAFLNVAINCSSLRNQTIAAEVLKKAEIYTEDVKKQSAYIVDKLNKELTAK
jgi:formiminotetrahydrofolate cyclodeaminase